MGESLGDAVFIHDMLEKEMEVRSGDQTKKVSFFGEGGWCGMSIDKNMTTKIEVKAVMKKRESWTAKIEDGETLNAGLKRFAEIFKTVRIGDFKNFIVYLNEKIIPLECDAADLERRFTREHDDIIRLWWLTKTFGLITAFRVGGIRCEILNTKKGVCLNKKGISVLSSGGHHLSQMFDELTASETEDSKERAVRYLLDKVREKIDKKYRVISGFADLSY